MSRSVVMTSNKLFLPVSKYLLVSACNRLQAACNCRFLASQTGSGQSIMNVFDRKAKRIQRNRTALMQDYKVYEYIKEEVGFRLADRVSDIKRQFPTVVELGSGRGYVSRHLLRENCDVIYQCEMADKMLMQSEVSPEVPTHRLVMDEECPSFKDNSIDLFVSSLSLHWVNDLPGCFKSVYNALKNDGVFLGCMFGGDTLFELRVSLQLAESKTEGGVAAHVSPFTDVRDLGNLLNAAGYTMLTLDVDDIVINYPSMMELMQDLKGMAENNCAWSRKPMLHRETIKAATETYKERYGNEKGVPATFQIIYFIGWKPDPSQPQPAKRGSGSVSLKDIDRLNEIAKDLGATKVTLTHDKTDPDSDKR